MTPRQVESIRASWTQVEPIQDVAATLFYDRLFELDPTLRRLFRRTDMAAQKKVLMQTLTVVVRSLDRLEIAIDYGFQVGVEGRDAGAFVLAKRGVDLA